MEQKHYPDKILDNKFLELVDNKIKEIRIKHNAKTQKEIKLNEVVLRSKVVWKQKPKSKHRHLQRDILKYLDYYIEKDSTDLSLKTQLTLRQEFLEKSNYLMQSEGYRHRGIWIWLAIIGLVVDIILIYNNVALLYFNVPLIFVCIVLTGIFKDHKAKKKGKLL